MKKIALFLLCAMMLASVYAQAAAVDKMDSHKALDKFGRGVTNIVTSPGEVYNQMPTAIEQSPDYLTGFVVAAGRGIGYTLLRLGSGIYDVATCPFAGPTDYKPIMKPETIADKVGETTISQTLPR